MKNWQQNSQAVSLKLEKVKGNINGVEYSI